MKYLSFKDAFAVIAALSVVYLVELCTTTALDKTEIGTMVAVTFCLMIFEAGRMLERARIQDVTVSCWSDFYRMLVVFVSVTLMYALYSKSFDGDEIYRISIIAVVYSAYIGIKYARNMITKLDEKSQAGLKISADLVWQTFLKSFAAAFGTTLAAGLTAALGFLLKPYLTLLLK